MLDMRRLAMGNDLYYLAITFALGIGEVKNYVYICTKALAAKRVAEALSQPNCYCITVDHNDHRLIYAREDIKNRPCEIKRVVTGVNGSITWLPVPMFSLPACSDETLKVLALEVFGYDINHVASLEQVDTKPGTWLRYL
jgi:hypothetical protein